MGQGGEPYWLKFYDQEDQALLFPAAVCADLRAILDRAAHEADDDATRARVALTSRAFAVTEAFVAFDISRRAMQGADDGLVAEPAPALRDFAAARAALVAAFADARAGGTPAMDDMPLDPFLRNDPRPTLAWRHLRVCADPQCRHLDDYPGGSAIIEGARLLRDRDAPSLAANGSFEIEGEPMQPEFLFPRHGLLPVAWRCQAMPTESGRVAVVETDAHAGGRVVRVEGAWDTEVFRWIPAQPGRIHVLNGWLRGRTSPGGTAALVLSYLDADNKPVGEYRMQSLPAGTTEAWTEFVLADRAPGAAAWVGLGVTAARQQAGDWLEADDLQLRSVNPGRVD